MSKTTIPPAIARMLVGDDNAMAGCGKLVFSGNKDRAIFGGVVHPGIGDTSDGGWQMSIGSFIWVPLAMYKNKKHLHGYRIDQLLTGYLGEEHWVKVKED